MQHTKIKRFILLLGLILPIAWCNAKGTLSFDEYSHIAIKERVAQDAPRGSSIQASINGHVLTVVFTENLGQVAVEVSSVSGTSVHFSSNAQNKGVSVT
jgi:hypothetical protein